MGAVEDGEGSAGKDRGWRGDDLIVAMIVTIRRETVSRGVRGDEEQRSRRKSR